MHVTTNLKVNHKHDSGLPVRFITSYAYVCLSILMTKCTFSTNYKTITKHCVCYIHNVFVLVSGQGSGFSVAGRVDCGHVQVGENVLILPAHELASIKCIPTCCQL